MSMSHATELKKACTEFQESLDQLQLGVPNLENNIPIEKDIVQLKEIAEFINSKINVIKVAEIQPKGKVYDNTDITEDTQELLDHIVQVQYADKALKNTIIGHTVDMILNTTTSEKGFETYKQKIIEQLEILRQNSEKIILIYEKQEEILNELCNVSKLINQTTEFKENLQFESSEYQKKHEQSLSETYKTQMDKINMRIRKINFMKKLICGLILYTNISSKYSMSFKDLLKMTRFSVTIDSLLKE